MPIASRLGFWFITPTTPPPPPPGPPVNPTPIENIIADYVLAQYIFPYGLDLDTRTKMTIPAVPGDYVGWGRGVTQSNIVTWGGDNTGSGVESVLINVAAYRAAYPSTDTFNVDFNCFWYASGYGQSVFLTMTLYTGGTMIKSGFTWTNPTATSTVQLTTTSKPIYEVSTSPGYNGAPLGYMEYNVVTGDGSIDIFA